MLKLPAAVRLAAIGLCNLSAQSKEQDEMANINTLQELVPRHLRHPLVGKKNSHGLALHDIQGLRPGPDRDQWKFFFESQLENNSVGAVIVNVEKTRLVCRHELLGRPLWFKSLQQLLSFDGFLKTSAGPSGCRLFLNFRG